MSEKALVQEAPCAASCVRKGDPGGSRKSRLSGFRLALRMAGMTNSETPHSKEMRHSRESGNPASRNVANLDPSSAVAWPERRSSAVPVTDKPVALRPYLPETPKKRGWDRLVLILLSNSAAGTLRLVVDLQPKLDFTREVALSGNVSKAADAPVNGRPLEH